MDRWNLQTFPTYPFSTTGPGLHHQGKSIRWKMFKPKKNNLALLMTVWFSLSQWPNFKLFGITYWVGKIKFKLFFSGSIGWVRVGGNQQQNVRWLNEHGERTVFLCFATSEALTICRIQHHSRVHPVIGWEWLALHSTGMKCWVASFL